MARLCPRKPTCIYLQSSRKGKTVINCLLFQNQSECIAFTLVLEQQTADHRIVIYLRDRHIPMCRFLEDYRHFYGADKETYERIIQAFGNRGVQTDVLISFTQQMRRDGLQPNDSIMQNTIRKMFNQYTFHENVGGGYGWRPVTSYSTSPDKGHVGKYVEGNIQTQIKNFMIKLDEMGTK